METASSPKHRNYIFLIAVVAVIIMLGFIGFALATLGNKPATANQALTSTSRASSTSSVAVTSGLPVMWQFNGQIWSAVNAPACAEPIVLPLPIDIQTVTSILYPGQVRGGNYKPHGGFRLDNNKDNNATITIPSNATLVRGSRYLESGEVQYMFDFITDCGIMHRFDHLLTLSPKFQALADKLPAPQPDDSRTNSINPPVAVTAGEVLATAVGHKVNNNVGFDWGVYDLRQKNKSAQNSTWLQQHPGETAPYAVCWLNWLSASDQQLVKSLPAGDPTQGKNSDYCI